MERRFVTVGARGRSRTAVREWLRQWRGVVLFVALSMGEQDGEQGKRGLIAETERLHSDGVVQSLNNKVFFLVGYVVIAYVAPVTL